MAESPSTELLASLVYEKRRRGPRIQGSTDQDTLCVGDDVSDWAEGNAKDPCPLACGCSDLHLA